MEKERNMKQFKTESKRILDLMINSIYTNKEIFLRELISNASDAIDKRRFIALTDGSAATEYEIRITADKDKRQLTVEDNGIGMSEADMEKNLGVIAESGTLAFKKENADEKELIGQFGVGFYSAFMVAKTIDVISRKYGEEKAFEWKSSGAEGYTVTPAEKESAGTKIVLTLKEDDENYRYSSLLEEYKLAELVKKYSDYIRYPIKMLRTHSKKKEDSDEYEQVKEEETINSMVPLWKKSKSEVTKEQLDEFSKDNFHDYEAPLTSIYAKIEGSVTYDTLLFVPSHAPYDYYSKDYKRGVKLYANGVLITEKCEDLLPDYFGFVKGIVDSGDLNLNISRELLQQDRQVKAIAASLEKKIVSELKKTLEEDRETYDKIFTEFGLSLKFGVYNNFGMKKDALKDLLLFYSSEEKKLVTLSEYVKRMKEGQTDIYYAAGETYDKIDKLPQVEKVKEKYEILYLKDAVDEFVLRILDSYEEKKFKSVTAADFSVESEEEKKALEEKNAAMKDVLEFIKGELKDKVKDVRLSGKLKTYPACLTSGGEISIEMEKVLNSMPNANNAVNAEKVLELNAEHPVTEKLKTLFETDKDALKKYAYVLYNQARLLEGLSVEDVTEFVTTLSDLL